MQFQMLFGRARAALPRHCQRCRRGALRLVLSGSLAGIMLAVPAPAVGQVHGWSVIKTPNAGRPHNFNAFFGVSCVSATACTAVGDYGILNGADKTLAESWNGTKWSVVATPNVNQAGGADALQGVSCVSATACIAVGGYFLNASNETDRNLAESWNGTKWSVTVTPNAGRASSENELNAVSCVSATACTAVGAYVNHAGAFKTLAESWNGTKWSVVATPNMGPASSWNTLFGVSCVSATACTAVGNYFNAGVNKTLAESWNGTKWSVTATPSAKPDSTFTGVSCVSAAACTAVGDYTDNTEVNRTLAESWNGTKWSVITTPNEGGARNNNELTGVSCVSAAACTAVGDHANRTLAESWNGTRWSVAATPDPSKRDNMLSGVSCVLVSTCTAAGDAYNASTRVPKTLIESN